MVKVRTVTNLVTAELQVPNVKGPACERSQQKHRNFNHMSMQYQLDHKHLHVTDPTDNHHHHAVDNLLERCGARREPYYCIVNAFGLFITDHASLE